MGIRGLTSYINRCSRNCLQDYELQNTYLVIDGNNIYRQLYYKYMGTTSSLCGGDYNVYEEVVINFFNNLLACKVIPLVLLDGGNEISMIDTVLKRCRKRHDNMLALTQHRTMETVQPLLLLHSFKQTLRKKNIRHVQCVFEADETIAAVAKILKCPVLSFDSDFYIYGTFYVPFDTLSSNVVKNSDNKNIIRCKLYHHMYLLNSFKGLNHRTLSLAAVLLGDEKINPEMLKNVMYQIQGREGYRNIIQNTLRWLSKRTVEKVITEIIRGIPQSMRRPILDTIESIINDYTCINVPAAVLATLSIPKYTMDPTTIYKYEGNIEDIKFNGVYDEHDFETIGDSESDLTKMKDIIIEHRTVQNGDDSIINKLPTWFADGVSAAKYSPSLINIIDQHAVIFPVQVEDVKRPTSSLIALKIVKVIYGLLSSMVDHKRTYMKYVIRDKNMDLICNELEGTRTNLASVRELSIIERKDILDDTLGVKNMKCIDELLPEWKLYIACIKYWSDQEEIVKSDKCYAASIILCILYNICCSKKFSKDESQVHDCKPNCSDEILVEAYRNIDVKNCTTAVQYFTRHSQEDKRSFYMRDVNISIVHAFAQFQISLLYAMDLNSLLGFPYEQPFIADLFNGTFLHNLCTELQKHEDISVHISHVLKDSPTMLKMFDILTLKVNSLLK
ncbi:protein asteroid-like isoform X1 [Lasioglossum baleicum]|uniref:protein asteroid-like isoform X1 n=1 Tax=Lasioglossum baleicum TaxID=434251 RepID=UPI003FCE99ED